jgi:pyruvate formate lyase activating enzyme
MTVAEVMHEVKQDAAFYDQSGGGVTFSGGEPLAQPAFLRELLQAGQERGLHTTLDTCGYAAWHVLDSVREHLDLFLYDLKLMDDARHRAFTGVSNQRILENLRELSQRGHRLVLRVPVIPGINDDDENVRRLRAFVADLPSLDRVDLLAYHRIGRDKYGRLGRICPMPETDLPTGAWVDTIAQRLRQIDLDVNAT